MFNRLVSRGYRASVPVQRAFRAARVPPASVRAPAQRLQPGRGWSVEPRQLGVPYSPWLRQLSTTPTRCCNAASGAGSGGDDPAKDRETVTLGDVPGVTRGDTKVMLFTCNVCQTRSARQISMDAYTNGAVLVKCPGCDSTHLIADNLDWFKLGKVKLEDVLRERGEKVVTDANVWDLTQEDLKLIHKQSTEEIPDHVPRFRTEPVDTVRGGSDSDASEEDEEAGSGSGSGTGKPTK